MGGRRFTKQRRTAVFLALALLAPGTASAQVYIPPPDDLIEPQPALPPATDPGVPPPAPPPPSVPATMTWDEAKAQARELGSTVRGANQGITDAPGAAGQIPGYQANYPGLTQYYDNPGNMYADGAAAGVGSDAYRTANSTTRPTVDVKRSDLSRANTVTADPNAYLQGMSADGSTGTTAASSTRRRAALSTTRPVSMIRPAAMAPAKLPNGSTSARSRGALRSPRSTSAAATSTASMATASRSCARRPTSSRMRSWR